MSGTSEGTWLLGQGPVGVAVAKVGVLTLIRAKARIQALVRHVGIVMIGHHVQPRPVFLTVIDCHRAGHVIWTFPRILSVQQSIFTNLTRMQRTFLCSAVLCVRVLMMGIGTVSRPGLGLKMSG